MFSAPWWSMIGDDTDLFPWPCLWFQSHWDLAKRSLHTCLWLEARSPRAQKPLSTVFHADSYLAERGVIPGRRSWTLWNQASSQGRKVWAEHFHTSAEGVAGRTGANTPCCVTLTWEKMHNSSLGGFTPPASHWHAHFCSRMITCSGGHRIDVAGTEGYVFKWTGRVSWVGLPWPSAEW